MRRLALAVVLPLVFATPLHADFLHGSVFLMPIGSGSEFVSHGEVWLYNDLRQPTYGQLSGTHSVTGPQTFTTAVTGDGDSRAWGSFVRTLRPVDV